MVLKFKLSKLRMMYGGSKHNLNPVEGVNNPTLDLVAESRKLNDAMINGEPTSLPSHKANLKRLLAIFGLLFGLALIFTSLYWLFFRPDPAKPAPAPAPKPTISYVKIQSDKELTGLTYGTDYSVQYSGDNYLVNVVKSPKRLIYNGKEVYRAEDIVNASLSKNGRYWALETLRQEVRSKRDENTKLVQETTVSVSTLIINGQKWGEKDSSRLIAVTNNGAPVILNKTGKQTPSQYGDALNEEVVSIGETEKFRTSYGVISFGISGDGSNWYATTANPSTKEIYDLFINNTRKDSLDARILKRVAIDEEGNYLLAFCQQTSDAPGVGILGKDCQISVNGKTRTTISGTVYLAGVLGSTETYAGIDKELKQSFVKNSRVDLVLEHSKDLDESKSASLGVYLNETGDKYAVTTSKSISGKLRVNLSINAELVSNAIVNPSLFGFGSGDEAATLYIYELPV